MPSLMFATLIACGEAGVSAGVEVTDGADITLGDGTPILRDTSEVEVALACPVPQFTGEAAIGRDDASWCFEPLDAGARLEIVRGLQGGIHVELRLAIASRSSEEPAARFEVDLLHAGTTVARFASGVVALEPLGEAASNERYAIWATPAFPVVFVSADPSPYHGVGAEVRASLVVNGEVLALPSLPVQLVDPTLAMPP